MTISRVPHLAPEAIATPERSPAWENRRVLIGLRIEKAALELFAEHGVDEVTVEQIAEAAEISERTFFRYFPTRDHVLVAMSERTLAASIKALLARPAAESILDAYSAAMRDTKASTDEQEIILLSARVMVRSPEAWSRALHNLNPRTAAKLSAAIGARLRMAGLDDAPASPLGAALAALVVHGHQSWARSGRTERLADVIDQTFQHLALFGVRTPEEP